MTPADLGPLFASPEEPGFIANPATDLERRFADFHRSNPAIYAEIERKALQLVDVEGRNRIGIAEIVEDIRYDHRIQGRGDSWKVNNSHRAFYARLLIHRYSRLASVIGTRKQTHYQGAA